MKRLEFVINHGLTDEAQIHNKVRKKIRDMFVNKKPDVNIELSTKIMQNERKNKSINESKFQIQKLSQKQDIEE